MMPLSEIECRNYFLLFIGDKCRKIILSISFIEKSLLTGIYEETLYTEGGIFYENTERLAEDIICHTSVRNYRFIYAFPHPC